jgi:transposase InsO family protein
VLIADTEPVTERLRVREIDDDEGQRLVRIIRRGSGSVSHAYRDVARYIEFRYNCRRRHSGLQYRTPQQVHDEYLDRQLAVVS